MAYYIDENKKTAVKYEGKNAFTWNVSTRKFDLLMPDVSPKSRMRRCSEFDARCYLFENDPVDYVGMVVVLKRILQRAESVLPNARPRWRNAKAVIVRSANGIPRVESTLIPLILKNRRHHNDAHQ